MKVSPPIGPALQFNVIQMSCHVPVSTPYSVIHPVLRTASHSFLNDVTTEFQFDFLFLKYQGVVK